MSMSKAQKARLEKARQGQPTKDSAAPSVAAKAAEKASSIGGVAKALSGVFSMDMYANALARLGSGQDNLLEASTYPMVRLTKNYNLMTSLYRNGWISKRIIDTPAEDMTRKWIEIKSEELPEARDSIAELVRKYRVRKKLTDALKWARLYGGAAAIINIAGQEDMMDQPLDLAMMMPGSFRGLIVLDRWNGISPMTELVTDTNDPEFGLPEKYMINANHRYMSRGGMVVHHSRVLRFLGRELPDIEEEGETFWGASELEHVFEELNKRNAASANIGQLIFQANLRYLKMSDLGQMLAMGSAQDQEELYNTIKAQNYLMSSFGIQVLDAQDNVETHPYSFSGVADVYKLFMSDIAGAAEIPATKLFGRSPEGMNATGESDLTNYYESIGEKQENQLRPILEKLLPVMCMSAMGMAPDDLDFEFKGVRTSTSKERADLAQQKSKAILDLYMADLIRKSVALKELRKMEPETGMFGSVTDEDIQAAEQEELNPMGMFPMGEGAMPDGMAPGTGQEPGMEGMGEGMQPENDPMQQPMQAPGMVV